jgi:hypothetical protein
MINRLVPHIRASNCAKSELRMLYSPQVKQLNYPEYSHAALPALTCVETAPQTTKLAS